jgi:hypothetical protein
MSHSCSFIFNSSNNSLKPITVAAQSKTWNVLARLTTGVVGSNPTRGMDVCVRLFCVCVLLCVGSGLVTGWSPVQVVLAILYRLRNWKSGQGPKGYRTIEKDIINSSYKSRVSTNPWGEIMLITNTIFWDAIPCSLVEDEFLSLKKTVNSYLISWHYIAEK